MSTTTESTEEIVETTTAATTDKPATAEDTGMSERANGDVYHRKLKNFVLNILFFHNNSKY